MRALGYDDYIKHSYSKHPTYYLVEDRKALRTFNNYKKSKVVTSERGV